MDRFTSPPALARLLGVAERTVYNWISKGTIAAPSVIVGGTRGFSDAEVSRIQEWRARRRPLHTEGRSE